MQPIVTAIQLCFEEPQIVPGVDWKPLKEKRILARFHRSQCRANTIFVAAPLQLFTHSFHEFLTFFRKRKWIAEGLHFRSNPLFDGRLRLANFIFQLLSSCVPQLWMGHGVGSKMNTRAMKFPYLAPAQTVAILELQCSATDVTGGQEHGCAKAVLTQNRHGMGVEVPESIVKRNRNTLLGPFSFGHPAHEIAQSDDRIVILVKKAELLRDHCRIGCRLI